MIIEYVPLAHVMVVAEKELNKRLRKYPERQNLL